MLGWHRSVLLEIEPEIVLACFVDLNPAEFDDFFQVVEVLSRSSLGDFKLGVSSFNIPKIFGRFKEL